MDATVIDIRVAVGDVVAKGHAIMILEAMKMEVVVSAPRDGSCLKSPVFRGRRSETERDLPGSKALMTFDGHKYLCNRPDIPNHADKARRLGAESSGYTRLACAE